MQGALTMGIIGLGWSLVSGLRRVPCPPAMMIAFTGATSWLGRTANASSTLI
jgi:hypothetical protein